MSTSNDDTSMLSHRLLTHGVRYCKASSFPVSVDVNWNSQCLKISGISISENSLNIFVTAVACKIKHIETVGNAITLCNSLLVCHRGLIPTPFCSNQRVSHNTAAT